MLSEGMHLQACANSKPILLGSEIIEINLLFPDFISM